MNQFDAGVVREISRPRTDAGRLGSEAVQRTLHRLAGGDHGSLGETFGEGGDRGGAVGLQLLEQRRSRRCGGGDSRFPVHAGPSLFLERCDELRG